MGIAMRVVFFILSLLSFFGYNKVQAQTSLPSNNLQEKYWNYRERFKKTFVNIGIGANKSLPLYNKVSMGASGRYMCDNNLAAFAMDASDNNLMDLGKYIAVLSTELALLKHNEQNYKGTMQELYFALAALNRLDDYSDKYHRDALPLLLDGRFMRDDYNVDSRENWLYYDSTVYIGGKAYSPFKWPYADGLDCSPKLYNYLNIMSKDEIIGILWGLAFVKRFVPNEFVDNGDGANAFYIVDEAVAIANRIMTYLTNLQTHDQKCSLLQRNVTIDENWVILYPYIPNHADLDIFKRDSLIGNDLWHISSPSIAALGNYITGGTYTHIKTKIRNGPTVSIFCRDRTTHIDGSDLYALNIRALSVDVNDPIEFAILTATLPAVAATAAYFQVGGGRDAGFVNAELNIMSGLVGPASILQMYKVAKNFKVDIRYELGYSIFHNTQPLAGHNQSYWENILNDAPTCEYVTAKGIQINRNDEFNCEYYGRALFHNFLELDPVTSRVLTKNDWAYLGQRNGLDFMFLYNAYHLQYKKDAEIYANHACDCERTSVIYSNDTTIKSGITHTKGRTQIESMSDYHKWGISAESFINKLVNIENGGTLKLLELVAICTQVNSVPTTVNVYGNLEAGSTLVKSTLRVGNNARLIVQSGGDLVIQPESVLKISHGGKLETKLGSRLILKQGSTLIVESGGVFEHFSEIIAESDAKIKIMAGGVLDYQSVFPTNYNVNLRYIVQGKIIVRTSFVLNNQAQMEFNASSSMQPLIEVMTGAEFKVLGNNSLQNKVWASDESKAQLRTFGTGVITFSTGSVIIGKNANIQLYGNLNIAHTHFKASGTALRNGNSVIIYPADQFSLVNSDFADLERGLDLILSSAPSVKSIISCDFSNNKEGMRITGKGFVLAGSTFTNNLISALSIDGINTLSNINGCTFSNSNKLGSGIVNKGAFQGLLKVNNCAVSGFKCGISGDIGRIIVHGSLLHQNEYAIQPIVGTIEATCSEIRNNDVAILTHVNGRFRTNAASRNLIHLNDIGFYGEDGGQFILFGGENSITNNLYNFGGITTSWNIMMPQTLWYNNSSYDFFKLNVSQNNVQPVYEPYVINNILHGTYGNLGALNFQSRNFSISPTGIVLSQNPNDFKEVYPIPSTTYSYSPCPSSGIIVSTYSHIEDLAVTSPPTSVIINNGHFLNTELKDALREAANHMSLSLEMPNQDSLAVLKFASILTDPNVLFSGDNLKLIGHAQTLMSEAISNAVSLGYVPVGDNIALDARVEDLINSIYEYIDAISSSGDEQQIAFKLLDILNLYRVSGHYNECLQLLQNETRLSALPPGVLGFWNCLINNEYQLINGHITLDDFVEANIECNSLMTYRKSITNIELALKNLNSRKNQTQNLLAYPNPAETRLEVRFIQLNKRMTLIRLMSVTGLVLSENHLSENSNHTVLDVSSVSSGVYFVEVTDQYGVKERVRVIRR